MNSISITCPCGLKYETSWNDNITDRNIPSDRILKEVDRMQDHVDNCKIDAVGMDSRSCEEQRSGSEDSQFEAACRWCGPGTVAERESVVGHELREHVRPAWALAFAKQIVSREPRGEQDATPCSEYCQPEDDSTYCVGCGFDVYAHDTENHRREATP